MDILVTILLALFLFVVMIPLTFFMVALLIVYIEEFIRSDEWKN